MITTYTLGFILKILGKNRNNVLPRYEKRRFYNKKT